MAVGIEKYFRVQQLHTAYVRCLDEEQFEEWPEMFDDSGIYRIIPKVEYAAGRPAGFVFCDSRGMLRDRISSMRRANVYERHTYRHMTSALHVEESATGVLTSVSNYIVVRIMHDGRQEIFSTGSYLDRLIDSDGVLLFKERIVLCDSPRLDSLLVIPL